MGIALVNGAPADSIGLGDRGLHYGDGLFETIAVVDGRPRLWEAHVRRLVGGCRRLGFPDVDLRLLEQEVTRVCADQARGVLKVIVTRGSGRRRGYRPGPQAETTRIVMLFPPPAYPAASYRRGVAARLCATRLGANRGLAGLKHLNRLEQVLACSEWDDPNIAEGVMLDQDGWVIEGTKTNLFVAKGGRLVTPALESCGVAGVMRAHLLTLAREFGIPAAEKTLSLRELKEADEFFLCNSLIGVWPVRRFEEVPYPMGPLAARLVVAVAPESLMSE